MRRSLIDALAACAGNPLKSKAHRFLAGLSSDELQFIAEFLGGCVPASAERPCLPLAERPLTEDGELKLVLVREYLAVSALDRPLVGSFSHCRNPGGDSHFNTDAAGP